MEAVKLNLTKQQMKKLSRTQGIRLKPYQLYGDQEIMVSTTQKRKIDAHRTKKKGMILQLTQQQVGANPFLSAFLGAVAPVMVESVFKVGKKLVGRGVKKTATPAQLEALARGRAKRAENLARKKKNLGLVGGDGMYLPTGGSGMYLPGTRRRR